MTSPLTRKAVVVTRALHQAEELNTALRGRGAIPLSYPCIAIGPAADPTRLNQAVRDLLAGAFEWVVFTSSNSVRAVADALGDERTRRTSSLQIPVNIATVGAATAQAVKDELGLSANLIPTDHNADHIAAELSAVISQGAHVFLPQSEIANPRLREQLAAIGAAVIAVTAYRTLIGSGGVDVPGLLRAGRVDVITFTSPSTVENFLQRLRIEGGHIGDLTNLCLACIGQTTARAVEHFGLSVRVITSIQSVGSLTDALEQYFAVERI